MTTCAAANRQEEAGGERKEEDVEITVVGVRMMVGVVLTIIIRSSTRRTGRRSGCATDDEVFEIHMMVRRTGLPFDSCVPSMSVAVVDSHLLI